MVDLSIDYDTWRGKIAVLLRRRVRELITVLALASFGVSIGGFCGYISQANTLIASLFLSILTIAEAWIGFEVYAEAKGTTSVTSSTSTVVSNVEYAEEYDGEDENNADADLNEE